MWLIDYDIHVSEGKQEPKVQNTTSRLMAKWGELQVGGATTAQNKTEKTEATHG